MNSRTKECGVVSVPASDYVAFGFVKAQCRNSRKEPTWFHYEMN